VFDFTGCFRCSFFCSSSRVFDSNPNLRFMRNGHLLYMDKYSSDMSSSCFKVISGFTYWNHSRPSFEVGILRPVHLHAKYIQKQATLLAENLMQKLVIMRLQVAVK